MRSNHLVKSFRGFTIMMHRYKVRKKSAHVTKFQPKYQTIHIKSLKVWDEKQTQDAKHVEKKLVVCI